MTLMNAIVKVIPTQSKILIEEIVPKIIALNLEVNEQKLLIAIAGRSIALEEWHHQSASEYVKNLVEFCIPEFERLTLDCDDDINNIAESMAILAKEFTRKYLRS